MLAGGCAAPSTHYPEANWYAGGPAPSRIDPEAVVAKAKASAPVTEDDGLPAQVPPRLAARRLPDDPSQPWSPNYGGPERKPAAAPSKSPAVAPSEQDRSAIEALQAMAARRVSWRSGN